IYDWDGGVVVGFSLSGLF
ncbi:hypothetical protein A2U01_0039056, partial [Trifolium medium]|nr:hypothetical protein [Trifolium medium]